jgi:hypothetical protein
MSAESGRDHEVLLGPILSTHEHTWLYRVVASAIGALLLSICIPIASAGAQLEAVGAATLIAGLLAWFFHRQGSERLFLHTQGLRVQRGTEIQVLRWSDLARLDVQWAYMGDPPGFFEAVLLENSGKRLVLRANWKNRESIDEALLELSAYDIPGTNALPR